MKIAKSAVIFFGVFFLNQVSSKEPNLTNTTLPFYTTNNTTTEPTIVPITNGTIKTNNSTALNSTKEGSDANDTTTTLDNTSSIDLQKIDTSTSSSENLTNFDSKTPSDSWSPSNSSNFKYTVENEPTDTEVQSLLDSPKPTVDDLAPVEPKHKYKDDDAIDPSIFMLDNSINVENLEGPKRLKMNRPRSSQLESAGLVPGTLAAILAGTFLIVSIVGYVMLMSWRRYLEKRYGNREMLVDDDYCEKMTDLEHFSI